MLCVSANTKPVDGLLLFTLSFYVLSESKMILTQINLCGKTLNSS